MLHSGILRGNRERGVALLISIFALVLISGVAVSLIIMAGTESKLSASYRRSVSAFYAAEAGIEEARERLVENSPNSLRGDPNFLNPLLPVPGQVMYIVNRGANDPDFDPQSDTGEYYDFQYEYEFGVPPVSNSLQRATSAAMTRSGDATPLPPLHYKWVRITLKTEEMAGIDLNGDGTIDNTTAIRVMGNDTQCVPGSPGCTNDPNLPITTSVVFRVTSYSRDEFGARRMVQAELAELPNVNPNGAIASKAGVDINGNFNAFGAWPPIVTEKCGSGKSVVTMPTCGKFVGGAVQADCTQPYDPVADTCGGLPRPRKDYCNVGNPVDSVTSAGSITAGASYDTVPDAGSSCTTTGPGCISTVDPQEALNGNISDWPYDMDQIIQYFQPPVSEPITNVSGVSCGGFDTDGNRNCSGAGVQMGTLPSPWPPDPGTDPSGFQPRLVYAETGESGLVKLTGASSGSGILVVEGDLEIQAGFQWYGLIVVRGVVTFLGGGSTSTNIVGGILAGESVTDASTTTGGSVSITYSSCAYRKFNRDAPLRYLSFREIPNP